MIDITDIVRQVVAATDVPDKAPGTKAMFFHGTKEFINYLTSSSDAEVKEDFVLLDEPIVSDDELKQGGLLIENYNLNLIFGRAISVDSTMDQHRAVINVMREFRRKFIIQAQNNNALIRFVTSPKTIDLFNYSNRNVSGVILQIRITPLKSFSLC